MIKIDVYDGSGADIFIRRVQDNPEVTATVANILADVKVRGDEAVREYTAKFDGCDMPSFEVSAKEWEEGAAQCDRQLYKVMEEAATNIADFHIRQIPQGFEVEKEDGIILGQKVIPLERVGIYVPGGTAAYPSTVLMNAVPAKIAGVKEIIMVTPAKKGGIKPEILAAAEIAGVTAIFKVGGAQAIGALAYGTKSIPRVDKITGPGNIYVATAKKLVFGLTDIDMIAGPSEILVLADGTASAARVAADMLSQAEHDVLASAVLVTSCARLAADTAALARGHSAQVHRRTGQDNLGGRYLSGGGYSQCLGARAFGSVYCGAFQIAPPAEKRRFDILGRIYSRAGGGLFRRAQPHAAHVRYRPLFLPSFGSGFRKALFLYLLYERSA